MEAALQRHPHLLPAGLQLPHLLPAGGLLRAAASAPTKPLCAAASPRSPPGGSLGKGQGAAGEAASRSSSPSSSAPAPRAATESPRRSLHASPLARRILGRRRLGEEGAGVGARQEALGLLRPRHGISRLRRLPRGDGVLGLDNFNDYYDTALERGRVSLPCLLPPRREIGSLLAAGSGAKQWQQLRTRQRKRECEGERKEGVGDHPSARGGITIRRGRTT
jgi:hypothetical protein